MKGAALAGRILAALSTQELGPLAAARSRSAPACPAVTGPGEPGWRGAASAVTFGPAGPDWRAAIWQGRASFPWRPGLPPPLRLPGSDNRVPFSRR
jgi:hypothetical protein